MQLAWDVTNGRETAKSADAERIAWAVLASVLLHAVLFVAGPRSADHLAFYLVDAAPFALSVRIAPLPERRAPPSPPSVQPAAESRSAPEEALPIPEQEPEQQEQAQPPEASPIAPVQPQEIELHPQVRIRDTAYLQPLPARLNRTPWSTGDYAREKELEEKPQPLVLAVPDYPGDARKAGVSGSVLVALLVDEAGRVVEAEAVDSEESLGPYRHEVAGVLRNSVFLPGRRGGEAVKSMVFQLVVFDLIAGPEVQVIEPEPAGNSGSPDGSAS